MKYWRSDYHCPGYSFFVRKNRFKMKKWFVYIVYISIVFLIIALIRGHYLSIPIVYSVKDMVICIVLLFSGFIFDALAWWKTLTGSGIMNISFKSALAGHRLLPGQVNSVKKNSPRNFCVCLRLIYKSHSFSHICGLLKR